MGDGEQKSGTRAKRPRRGRVLVVDDEPLLAHALQHLLVRDHAVAVATDGRAALASLASGERYDVILCDIIMPGMDGLTFYQAVRRDHVHHAVRIVFMTGGILAKETRRLMAAVPNLIIEKPFTSDDICRLVASRVLVELEAEAESAAAAGDE
jgi:CheY-like chemotaxis protein